MEIVLPDPSVVVLVGPAGAGKSTLAARHFDPSEVLSSDAFRAYVGDGEGDQAATRPAFAALHAALARRLRQGRLIVVDATNVHAHARRALIRRAMAAGVPAVAIVLDLSLAECVAGDLARIGRHVDARVIEDQWRALRRTPGGPAGLAAEGFAAVYRLTDAAERETLLIRRTPAG